MAQAASDDRRSDKRVGLVFLIRQQVAGVIGAIGLAAMLDHIVRLDWRSFVAVLIGAWNDYVAGFVGWVLWATLALPVERLFHVRVDVPLLLKDYLALGLVFTFSWFRAQGWYAKHSGFRNVPPLRMIPIWVAIWPLVAFAMLFEVAKNIAIPIGNRLHPMRTRSPDIFIDSQGQAFEVDRVLENFGFALAMSPVAYLLMLIALNYWLLR